jgi:uncharacterized membrane protein (DUF2068 family)
MWEENPAYQKAQAVMIGLIVTLLFVSGAIHCISIRDWELLRLVLWAGLCFVAAIVILPLAVWAIIKACRCLRGNAAGQNET